MSNLWPTRFWDITNVMSTTYHPHPIIIQKHTDDPLVVSVQKLSCASPFSWLSRGIRDLQAAARVSLFYGLFYAIIGAAIVGGLWMAKMFFLLIPLTMGFFLIGPITAVGIYHASKSLETGARLSLRESMMSFRPHAAQLGLMGLALVVLFLAWIRLATLLVALFFYNIPTDLPRLVHTVLFSAESLPFLLVGNGIGACFAILAFSVSVISIPLLFDKNTNVMRAILLSMQVVAENPLPMAVWGLILVALVGLGLATGFIGLVVTLPLAAHASWHAYRDSLSFHAMK